MAFVEDLDEFLPEDGPGVVGAVYTPKGGLPTSIVVSFYRPYFEPLGNLVESSAPMVECKAADVPDLAQGDRFVINGIAYESAGNEPDGQGWMRIKLDLA
ncbi:MAG: head-tail joining protein [Gemmatimonadaceae bacterium]